MDLGDNVPADRGGMETKMITNEYSLSAEEIEKIKKDRARIAELLKRSDPEIVKEVEKLREAIRWMCGSKDFQEGGCAYSAFRKSVMPLIPEW